MSLAGLISIPPLALSALEPDSVPAVRVTRPLTVTSPVPVSVPPMIESVLSIVEAAAIESVPPEIVRGSRRGEAVDRVGHVLGVDNIRGDVDCDVVGRSRNVSSAPI